MAVAISRAGDGFTAGSSWFGGWLGLSVAERRSRRLRTTRPKSPNFTLVCGHRLVSPGRRGRWLDQIELDPGIGSPTLGKRLRIPGLRGWRLGKFPLLWCYFERADHLDVVRLLGERQDIAAILGDEFTAN
jgi:hypothetical protein